MNEIFDKTRCLAKPAAPQGLKKEKLCCRFNLMHGGFGMFVWCRFNFVQPILCVCVEYNVIERKIIQKLEHPRCLTSIFSLFNIQFLLFVLVFVFVFGKLNIPF